MFKKFILFTLFLLFANNLYAGQILNPMTGKIDIVPTVQEEDGDPSVYAPTVIKVSNDSLTDNGDGSVSICTDLGLSFSLPLSESGGTVSISEANTTTDGYLNSVDWNSFNDKLDDVESDTSPTLGGDLAGGSHNITGLASVTSGANYLTTVQFDDANHTPDAAGELLYDNTITGLTDGGFSWFDDDAVRYLVDVTAFGDDDYVVAYDAEADCFYMKQDANDGGATALDDISDPDAATVIATDDDESINFETAEDTGSAVFIESTDADLSGDTHLLHLGFQQATDTNQIYISCVDNLADVPDLVFKVGVEGIIYTLTGLDAIGAVDMDYGSVDVTDHTFVSDGGTTIIDGAVKITEQADAGADVATYGQLWVNTATPNQFVFTDDAGNDWRFPGYFEKGFVLEDPAAADDDVPFWHPHDNITITDVYCETQGGTSCEVIISDGTNVLETITCDADGQADDGSIANGAFTADERMEFDIGTVTGSVDWVSVSITYTVDLD